MEEQENTNDDTLEKPKTAPNDNQQQDTQAQPQTQSKSKSLSQSQSQPQPQTDNKLTQNSNNNMQLPLATEPSTSKVAQAVATVSATPTPATFKTIPALAATVTTYSAATTFIDNTLAAEHSKHSSITKSHNPQQQESFLSRPLSFEQANQLTTTSRLIGGSTASISSQQQAMDRLSRSMAFDKMEALVREMQDSEHGVPCRHQKIFLTSIPYAFMGYDLIEWLMDRLIIEESEALSIANQLCLHGYFFPVSDTKSLTVKDDSSLYRFQTPYYWPCQHKAPDNVEYAIYLTKRTLRNKQRHALEDYEAEALQSLHKNLKGKWDFISMQAEEQVRLSKERKKGDKIVADSQERAYWRVHRPPPGQFTPLEPCPIPSRDRQGTKPKRKNIKDVEREVEYLRKSLNRTRMKMSLACESLVQYSNTFAEYDFFLRPVLPSNPWVTEDITFWQLNNTFVDIPTELRVKRWAISIEELVSDPTGLQEFTNFLEKEFSHENIRFWIAVNKLRRSAHSQVTQNVKEIYEEFLKPGAPCEINIDGKTMERVLKDLENPSRFAFDAASEHIYMLLLKKDCYPRFIRSEHYKRLLETGIQPAHKKRFFNFSAVSGAKKKMTDALRNQPMDGNATTTTKTLSGSGTGNANLGMIQTPSSGTMTRRRGSDRSLSGSAHELTVMGVNKEPTTKVIHSHSQSNLNEIPFRDITKKPVRLETTLEHLGSSICPWDDPADAEEPSKSAQIQLSVCPWEQDSDTGKLTPADSIEVTEPERSQRNVLIRHQHTVDSTESGVKRLIPHTTEQRRASVSFTSSLFSEKPMEKILSESPSLDSHTLPVNTKPILREDMNLNKLMINKTENRVEANLTTTQIQTPTPTTTPTPPLKKQSCLSTDNIFETSNNKDNENVICEEAQKTNIKLNEKEQVEVENEGEFEVEHELKVEEDQKETLEEDGTVQDVQIELIENMETVSVHDIEIQTDVNADVHVEVEVDTVLDLELLSDDKKEIISTTLLLDNEMPAKPIEDYAIIPEELSPTSDEYQEGSQIQENHSDICDFEISDSCTEYGGYIPPAPTPAPSLAPLAELDNDNVDDDLFEAAPSGILQTPANTTTTTTTTTTPILNSEMKISTTGIEQQQQQQKSAGDEIKKRRKKRSSVKNRATSGEMTNLTGDQISNTEQNTVCPWEDENNTSNGGSFVKTYATLGYL